MLICLLLTLASPADRARAIADKLPFAHAAHLEVRKAAGAIKDGPLRAAVEAQLAAPWLPPEAWAYAHPAEAAKLLKDRGLLDGALDLPRPGAGRFSSAPGGPCEDGHHGYPGGLAVHTWVNLQHARALADIYRKTYDRTPDDDTLVAAAIWHDSLKASTLPWKENGSCGPEPRIAGTAAHHILGLASGYLRHLPADLLLVIASAHLAPTPGASAKTVCGWLQAAAIIANGEPQACPAHAPPEAFISNSADSDYALTGAAWTFYASKAPKGWARYDALLQDGNDVLFYSRQR
jgi:hypothetical protein